jgi:hypothetical protein
MKSWNSAGGRGDVAKSRSAAGAWEHRP